LGLCIGFLSQLHFLVIPKNVAQNDNIFDYILALYILEKLEFSEKIFPSQPTSALAVYIFTKNCNNLQKFCLWVLLVPYLIFGDMVLVFGHQVKNFPLAKAFCFLANALFYLVKVPCS